MRNNQRASHALLFNIGLRQAKVVDGIRGNSRIRHGIIVSGGRGFHPRLAGAVRRCVKDVLSVVPACAAAVRVVSRSTGSAGFVLV